jgi:hypothetical protein
MKLGIVGLPQSGKSTTFAALTGARGQEGDQKGSRPDHKMGTLRVADERVDFLTLIYKPKKATYAQISTSSLSASGHSPRPNQADLESNTHLRCPVHVVRNFVAPGVSSRMRKRITSVLKRNDPVRPGGCGEKDRAY